MARRLVEARNLVGIDAQAAATRFRVAYSTYKNWEDGQRGFIKRLFEISQSFKVDVRWLRTGVGKPRPTNDTHPLMDVYEDLPPNKQAQVLEYAELLRSSKS